MVKKEKLAKLCKERMIDEIVTRIEKHPNFFIANYMGSSVADLELLRKNLKKSSSTYFVVKNSVLRVVFDKLKLEEAKATIDSGVGISLSGEDIIATCKTLVNFTKDHNKFKVKAGYVEGKMVTSDKVIAIASLPTKEVLLAQVVGGIKSPITGFVNVLSGVLRKFVYVVDAIKVNKEKVASSAQAAPAAQS